MGKENTMNKFAKFFKKMLTPSSYKDCLNAVKAKYGAVGDAIYREPGVMVYRKNGINDLLCITLDNFNKKIKQDNSSIIIETLFPMETTYQQYLSRVGELTGFVRVRRQVGPHRMVNSHNTALLKVSPERYENRCGEGGLSRIYHYNNKSYFCPSSSCTI